MRWNAETQRRRVTVDRFRRWMAGWRQAAGELAFPAECQICGASDDGDPICAACRGADRRRRPRGARDALTVGPWARRDGGCSVCRDRSLGFDAAFALGPYQGPIRSCCLALKHQRGLWLAALAGGPARRGPGRELADAGGGRGGGARPAALAAALATRVQPGGGPGRSDRLPGSACRCDGPCDGSARPGRWRGSPARNGHGSCGRPSRVGRMSRLAGRTVLLVDDIMTTGATCGAAARALKRAGARRVVAVVVARAEGWS